MKKTALATSALLLLSACSSTPPEPIEPQVETTSIHAEGVPGGLDQYVVQVSARVKAIDYKTRQITLEDAEGGQKSLTVSDQAINFDQIKRGDQVTIALVEELIVQMKKEESDAQEDVRQTLLADRAPEGSKPRIVLADRLEVTVTVAAVDLENHTATLTFPDGHTRTVKVREDVTLDASRVGQQFIISLTKGLVLSVRKN